MHPLTPIAPLVAHAAKSCPSDMPLSCHNSSAVADTCCFIPAGQLLQTQFWDTRPPTGPSDSWTIHGLWPDNCDGTYPSQCDRSRAYRNLTDLLSASSHPLLDYMSSYWKDFRGDDDSLWEHEWAKHGTCVSTLAPRCYGRDYRPGLEAVAYFDAAVRLFKRLPTYDWLADAGIRPDAHRTYDVDDIHDALEKHHGAPVTLRCRGGALNEVWYHFNVRGSLQAGQFVAADPDGPKSSCGSRVHYYPKRSRDDDNDDDDDDWARMELK